MYRCAWLLSSAGTVLPLCLAPTFYSEAVQNSSTRVPTCFSQSFSLTLTSYITIDSDPGNKIYKGTTPQITLWVLCGFFFFFQECYICVFLSKSLFSILLSWLLSLLPSMRILSLPFVPLTASLHRQFFSLSWFDVSRG